MSVIEITYHSHACFSIVVDRTRLMIDPLRYVRSHPPGPRQLCPPGGSRDARPRGHPAAWRVVPRL